MDYIYKWRCGNEFIWSVDPPTPDAVIVSKMLDSPFVTDAVYSDDTDQSPTVVPFPPPVEKKRPDIKRFGAAGNRELDI